MPEDNANTPNFEKVLDDKLSVFTRKVTQQIEDVNRKIDDVKIKPDDEIYNEDTEITPEVIEKIAERKAEEKVTVKIKELETKQNIAATEQAWFNKALNKFPDLKNKESRLWKEAGKIYESLPPNARLAEDVVYNCALRAKDLIEEEARNMANNNNNNRTLNKGSTPPSSDPNDNVDDDSGLSTQQKQFCRIFKLDEKKYAERVKARVKK